MPDNVMKKLSQNGSQDNLQQRQSESDILDDGIEIEDDLQAGSFDLQGESIIDSILNKNVSSDPTAKGSPEQANQLTRTELINAEKKLIYDS